MSPNVVANRFEAETPAVKKLLSDLNNPWKMRLYYWQRLPSLLFWGVRIQYCDPYRAEVAISFRWRTQNPFRSTYFAALCGAAELSTGVLGLIAVLGRGNISMLITRIEANFIKKATGLTIFTCEEGHKLREAVQRAIDTGEAQQVQITSVGRNSEGETIATATLTWSFKRK